MRRKTHLLLGAAVAMPIAASLSLPPAAAAGCVWWGVVGGGFPDWLDLRSDFRKPLRLRHRGASHGLPVAVMAGVSVYVILRLLAEADFALNGGDLAPDPASVWPWTLCFVLGVLSHLLSDACTHAGIRPLLPFSDGKVWLLPKLLRSRSDGYLDRLAALGASIAVIIGVAYYASLRLV